MSDEIITARRTDDYSWGLRKAKVAAEHLAAAMLEGDVRDLRLLYSCVAPLAEGELEGTVTICPWYGGPFEITS
jgi:hypothetical protein